MKTVFYVYKNDGLYLKIKTNRKETGPTFIVTFVKDINRASYWDDKQVAKGWYLEKKFPNIKLIPCGLCETKK